MSSNFTYNYYSGTNKLQNLNGGANYIYDEIGNLIADPSQNVTSIDWTPYGKVRQVTKGDGTTVSFKYDGAGNRIEKATTSGGTTTILHYIRDASGNVMAMYENDTLQSQPIYGSSRLGMYKGGNRTGERNLGNKQYELSNHLGNVLAVVTDNINMSNDSTTATVVSASDYYPFGLEMPGRTFSSEDYQYGFNGKEKDQNGEFGNTHYDYGFRIYNPEIGKFLSVDPLIKSFPMLTPYQFASNTPIVAIDLDGLEMYTIHSMAESYKFDTKLRGLTAEEVGTSIESLHLTKEFTNPTDAAYAMRAFGYNGNDVISKDAQTGPLRIFGYFLNGRTGKAEKQLIYPYGNSALTELQWSGFKQKMDKETERWMMANRRIAKALFEKERDHKVALTSLAVGSIIASGGSMAFTIGAGAGTAAIATSVILDGSSIVFSLDDIVKINTEDRTGFLEKAGLTEKQINEAKMIISLYDLYSKQDILNNPKAFDAFHQSIEALDATFDINTINQSLKELPNTNQE